MYGRPRPRVVWLHPLTSGYVVAEYRASLSDPMSTSWGLNRCFDDAEAIARANLLADDHDIELWSGNRLVVRIKASRLS